MVIRVAGIPVDISHNYMVLKELCERYAVDERAVFSIDAEDVSKRMEDILRETPQLLIGRAESLAALEAVHEALLEFGCLFFHAAAVEKESLGFLFSGPSGAGKSTHARLWESELGATVINEDKIFLRRIDGTWYIANSPWTGKEHVFRETDRFVPLRGIAFISQAPVTTMHRFPADDAATYLLRQTRMPNDAERAELLLDLIDSLASDTPCFELFCTDSWEAAELAFHKMRGENA